MLFDVRLALNGLGVPKWRLNFLANHFVPAGSDLNATLSQQQAGRRPGWQDRHTDKRGRSAGSRSWCLMCVGAL